MRPVFGSLADRQTRAAAAGEQESAPVGYRYRVFHLGKSPKEGEDDARVKLLARTELDGVMKGKDGGEDLFLRLYALNEIDAKLNSSIDWRQKLESQRGAVLATELKNNSNKLAKWTLQAILANADVIKLGYVSRAHVKKADSHVILGTDVKKPREFATQVNLQMPNAWGILRHIIDLCLAFDEGKYLLLKDPNKPVVRLYSIPLDAFDDGPVGSSQSSSRTRCNTMVRLFLVQTHFWKNVAGVSLLLRLHRSR